MHARNRINWNALFIGQFDAFTDITTSINKNNRSLCTASNCFPCLDNIFPCIILIDNFRSNVTSFLTAKINLPNPSQRNVIYSLATLLHPRLSKFILSMQPRCIYSENTTSSLIIFLLSAICTARSRFRGS